MRPSRDPITLAAMFDPGQLEPPSTKPMQQGSWKWRLKRAGVVTASRFRDAISCPRSKRARDAGELSESAKRYLEELIAEKLTGYPCDTYKSEAMRWGVDTEPKAFAAAIGLIEKRFGERVEAPSGDFAFIEHPTEPDIGCSPDGMIGDRGLLELKCPFNPAVHVRTMLAGEMPSEHRPQVQGSLWVSRRDFYVFGSYCRQLEGGMIDPLFLIRVDKDHEYVDTELVPPVLRFRDHFNEVYTTLYRRLVYG